jgi:hypothetical protein
VISTNSRSRTRTRTRIRILSQYYAFFIAICSNSGPNLFCRLNGNLRAKLRKTLWSSVLALLGLNRLKAWMGMAIVILVGLITPLDSHPDSQNDNKNNKNNENSWLNNFELKALVRANLQTWQTDTTTHNSQSFISRILIDGDIARNWNIELNARQSLSNLPFQDESNTNGNNIDLNAQGNYKNWESQLDRAVIRYQGDRLNMALGRQAINLASNFYFSPNDFFEPFAARDFYRVYKPGVDALRLDINTSELAQLSYIHVRNFSLNSSTISNSSNNNTKDSNNHLVQYNRVIGEYEAVLILANLTNQRVLGSSIQGELLLGIGLRMEAQYGDTKTVQTEHVNTHETFTKISIGLEKRWPNNVEIRTEIFYDSSSHNIHDIDDNASNDVKTRKYSNGNRNRNRNKRINHSSDQFSDHVNSKVNSDHINSRRNSHKNYAAALGLSFEAHPLLQIGLLGLRDNKTETTTAAVNALLSLGDESELVLNINRIKTDRAGNLILAKNIRSTPTQSVSTTLSLEWRMYF